MKAISHQLLNGQARLLTELVPTADEVVDLGVHAILKPARIGSETPWHQDEAYWEPGKNYLGLSVWLPLQEATVENGCMQFIPGTHTWEVQPHHHVDDDPRIAALIVDDGIIDTNQAVACPLPAGGATFHTCRTFHYTAPNHSEQPRRAFVLTASMPMPEREVPRYFYWQQEKRTSAGKRREEAARRREEAQKS